MEPVVCIIIIGIVAAALIVVMLARKNAQKSEGENSKNHDPSNPIVPSAGSSIDETQNGFLIRFEDLPSLTDDEAVSLAEI